MYYQISTDSFLIQKQMYSSLESLNLLKILDVTRLKNQCLFRKTATEVTGLPWWLSWKESTCNVGYQRLIPGLRRSAGEGIGYPLQYSGLENSRDCIVHGVAKSRTRLSDFCFHTQMHSWHKNRYIFCLESLNLLKINFECYLDWKTNVYLERQLLRLFNTHSYLHLWTGQNQFVIFGKC